MLVPLKIVPQWRDIAGEEEGGEAQQVAGRVACTLVYRKQQQLQHTSISFIPCIIEAAYVCPHCKVTQLFPQRPLPFLQHDYYFHHTPATT